MAKRLSIFFSKNPILTKIIIFLILFVTIFSGYLFITEFYYNNWTKKEGFDNPYNMILNITDNTGKASDPNPNGFFTASILSDKITTIKKTDISMNGNVTINYDASSILLINIIPKNTNINKIHYADVFPKLYEIDIYLDPNCSANKLITDDGSNSSDFNPRVNITTNDNNNYVLFSKQVGIISDTSYNDYGYIRSDTSNPYHYYITIRKPVDLSSITLQLTS
jgi:hypothetical protein